jgi:glutamine synthetase
MDAVRARVDALEKITAKKAWPFPGYEELLFIL